MTEYNHLDSQTDISFCLPVYNVRPFLEDCLQSIITQNMLNISYEILCVDDGSTDGSYEYLLERANSISCLRVLQNPENKGVSYTRNRMIREATGKYIWFVDPDDMLYKNVANYFFQQIEKLQADVLLGNFIRIPEETKGNEKYEMDFCTTQTIAEKKKDFLPTDETNKPACSVWGGLFLREFLLSNGLSMNEKMIAQEDTLFYYEFALKTDNIYKLELPCYLYRQRKTSVMHSHSEERSKKYYLAMREMLRVYKDHLTKKDYKDLTVLQRKIHHSQQNIATCLAAISDKKYIKQELKILKKEKVYPYKFRKAALKTKDPLALRIVVFLMPIKPFFWLYHKMYQIRNKKR